MITFMILDEGTEEMGSSIMELPIFKIWNEGNWIYSNSKLLVLWGKVYYNESVEKYSIVADLKMVLRRYFIMKTKDVILELRTNKGLSQDELAEKIYVTRQAVSRWENGETIPNTETLKLLSKFFDVSINTLLGSPRKLICQCCGMPLDDATLSKEPDGAFNEEYCKWCYSNGNYTYKNIDDLIDFCAEHMANETWTSEQVRAYMADILPKLNYWKQLKQAKE